MENNNKTRTAVDYIVNVVNSCIAPDYIPNEIVKQAKQMEKEQIMKAIEMYYPHSGRTRVSEKYYNETYKQQDNTHLSAHTD